MVSAVCERCWKGLSVWQCGPCDAGFCHRCAPKVGHLSRTPLCPACHRVAKPTAMHRAPRTARLAWVGVQDYR
jgi:hypothetical protein